MEGFLFIEGAHVDPRYSPYECCAMGFKYLRGLGKKLGM